MDSGELQRTIFIYGSVVVLLLISLSIHEAAHALVAFWRGDDTAKNLGRLTINPMRHLDPVFSVVLPVLCVLAGTPIFGGAKPVPVNPYKLRHPGRDMALVAVAGPFSNLILALGFFLLSALSLNAGIFTMEVMGNKILHVAGVTNLVLAVFNMIPIPPLDGSRVMGYLLPRPLAEPYLRLEPFGLFLVLGLFYLGVFGPIVSHAVRPAYHQMCDWLSIYPAYFFF